METGVEKKRPMKKADTVYLLGLAVGLGLAVSLLLVSWSIGRFLLPHLRVVAEILLGLAAIVLFTGIVFAVALGAFLIFGKASNGKTE